MTRMKTWILGLMSAIALAACGDDKPAANTEPTPKNTPKAAQKPTQAGKTYRVLSEQNYIPFISHKGNGEVSGFEYDILQAIAEKQGFSLTYNAHTWHDLFPALQRGEGDVLASGITVTDERKKNMDFTDSHINAEIALLTKDKQINHFNDMASKKIAVKTETTHQHIATQYQKGNGSIQAADTTWQTVNAVLQNGTDGALGDINVLNYYVKQYPKDNLKVITDPQMPKEQLAFAVSKGNDELRQDINAGLAAIKSDGTYQRIYEKWFGKQAQQ